MLGVGVARVLLGCALFGVVGGLIALATTGLGWVGLHRLLNRLDDFHERRATPFTPFTVRHPKEPR